jgi:hypothetical protein
MVTTISRSDTPEHGDKDKHLGKFSARRAPHDEIRPLQDSKTPRLIGQRPGAGQDTERMLRGQKESRTIVNRERTVDGGWGERKRERE